MIRALFSLIVCATLALAQDPPADFDARMAAGEPRAALEIATREHDKQPSAYWAGRRAKARIAVARELQRQEGYDAAIAWLESRFEHAKTAYAFGLLCLWAGREEHGLQTLRASTLPIEQRWFSEIKLLMYQYRYDEAAQVAERAGNAEWAEWCRKESSLRERLHERTTRGWQMTIAGVGLMIAVFVTMVRGGPRATA